MHGVLKGFLDKGIDDIICHELGSVQRQMSQKSLQRLRFSSEIIDPQDGASRRLKRLDEKSFMGRVFAENAQGKTQSGKGR